MKEEKRGRDGLFPIGEVSGLFHLSVSTLRHYDRTGLLKPEYTDPETGYRYYSVRQFECLNTIRYLRALDMSLEQIGGFLKSRNIEGICSLLNEQKREVERRRQELKKIERKIENRLSQIADALSSEFDTVCMIQIPPVRMASIQTKIAPKTYLDLEQSIRKLDVGEEQAIIFLGKVGVGISKEHLLTHQYLSYDMVFVLLEEEDCFCKDTVWLPGTPAVSLRFQGGHEKADVYYGKLMEYIEKNRYAVSGFSREVTMIDYGLTDDPSKFVTEIQIPVTAGVSEKKTLSTEQGFSCGKKSCTV